MTGARAAFIHNARGRIGARFSRFVCGIRGHDTTLTVLRNSATSVEAPQVIVSPCRRCGVVEAQLLGWSR